MADKNEETAEQAPELAGETVYVKNTEQGLKERIAYTPSEHVNLIARGWVAKGSPGAPKGRVAKVVSEGDSNRSAASVRAHHDGDAGK
jgi:hypothetical protein